MIQCYSPLWYSAGRVSEFCTIFSQFVERLMKYINVKKIGVPDLKVTKFPNELCIHHVSLVSNAFANVLVSCYSNISLNVNAIRSSLFSLSPGPRGGRVFRGPDAKNQGYHQPIETKFCISHYSHKSMPDAKFESGGFSTKFSSEEGNESSNSVIYLRKMSFYVQNRFFNPKLTPNV